MNKKGLIKIADSLPHMGAKDIQNILTKYASKCPDGACIVECGTWMGSGTAFLSIGCDGKRQIHSYDHFISSSSEVEKLKRFGVNIRPGINTLPMVKENLKPFPNIKLHKTLITKTKWNKSPIGVYVDDAAKQPPVWSHVVNNFLPYVIENGIIILMDFYFFRKTKREKHKAQYKFMKKHSDKFTMLWSSGCVAVFKVMKKFRGIA